MKQRFLLLLLLLCVGTVSFSQQEERITNYEIDIKIDTSSDIFITERITIYAKGSVFKRGIEREVPNSRTDKYGERVRVRFDLLSVEKDGETAPYHTLHSGGNTVIRVGESDVFLAPGPHTYELNYRYEGQIGYFETTDELYWTVIGHNWRVPIDRVKVNVLLPQEVSSIENACYTGVYGSTQQNCTVLESGNTITFTRNEPLNPGEGMTIVSGFTPGVIAHNIVELKVSRFAWLGFLSVIAGVFAYFFFTWTKFGRDPFKPTSYPLFDPPENLSPATLRFIDRGHIDQRAFTASIVDLGVKGALKIEQDKRKKVTLVKTPGYDASKLERVGKDLYDELFQSKDVLEIKGTNNTRLISAYDSLKRKVKLPFSKNPLLKHNIGWYVLGLFVTAALLFAYLQMYRLPMNQGENIGMKILIVVLFFVFQIGLLIIAGLLFPQYRKRKSFELSTFSKVFKIGFQLVFFGIFFFSFGSTLIGGLYSIVSGINVAGISHKYWPILLLGLLLILANVVYFFFIKQPSSEAQRYWSEINGFKMYLKTAEEKRFNKLQEPEKTLELFERLLPYAIAFNAENKWGDKFDHILSKAIQEENYQPTWYDSHRGFSSRSLGRGLYDGLSSSFGKGLTPPAPSGGSSGGSWSSGGGGGGFSGGGGGGGGGGGW